MYVVCLEVEFIIKFSGIIKSNENNFSYLMSYFLLKLVKESIMRYNICIFLLFLEFLWYVFYFVNND